MKRLLCLLLCLFSGLGWAARAQTEQRVINVAPGVDLAATVQGSGRRGTLLWIHAELGIAPSEREAATRLAALGYRVWLPDLYAPRFLPLLQSSMAQVPASDIRALIRAAKRRTRPFYLVASGSGAARALEAAPDAITGAVLFSPNLLTDSPEAGEDPTYLPIVTGVRLPISILQSERSPWFWQLDTLRAKLEQGGAQVRIQTLPGVRDRFFFREDASPAERELGARLATLVDEAIRAQPIARRKSK